MSSSPPKPQAALHKPSGRTMILLLLFTLSGASALIYQVSWQRALFSITGIDLESTTIVVSLFMFGLGVGALLGGQFADRYPQRQLLGFALIEAGTGLYGLMSIGIIQWVSELNSLQGLVATFSKAFIALIFPTLLMGATLPILIAHQFKENQNIGVSTGSLYTANTLGAALGAGITGFYLFDLFGLSNSVYIAALLNLSIAGLAYTLLSKRNQ